MAKFEITLTCEQWTDKSSQPDEDAIRALLGKTQLVEIETDMDEVDWTDLNANWEINLYAEFECANGEERDIATEAEAALKSAGFRHVSSDLSEEDYPMGAEEILETFRDTILPDHKHRDRIAIWEQFQFYIDSLNKRGMITDWQAEHTDNPWSKS